MDIRYSVNPRDVKRYTTDELRDEFLITDLFTPDAVSMTYSHVDRMLTLGICPVKPITLAVGKEFGVEYLLERREMGIVNISPNPGTVVADGTSFELPQYTALYLGKGTRTIVLSSHNPASPAKFYALSCPAHGVHPAMIIPQAKTVSEHLGSRETCNERTIYKYLHPDVLTTCQLSMGMTVLEPGCVWNTMPVHTHERRMEVYLYFNLPDNGIVFHYMGEPVETRHIVMHNEQAVISPSWSIHSGCGTASYTFIWGMCGENQTFGDMDHVAMHDVR